ncbi:MAG: CPBP family intramembrane metalloprotease [Deltaproteobacteria bacterium]|nr:CPBP family intramembrane metalloprotease [Deltaproteobacteria bacterium]
MGNNLNNRKSISRVSIALFYAGFIALALVWGWLRREPGVFFTGAPLIKPVKAFTGPWSPWAEYTLLGLLVAVIAVIVSRLMHVHFRWARVLEREMIKMIGPISVLDAAYISLVSGVAEELLFRGGVQPQFGYVIASIVFGAVHFVPDKKFLPWTISALAMGFVLGGLALLTGNLLAPMTAHITMNFINLLRLRRLAPLFGVNN